MNSKVQIAPPILLKTILDILFYVLIIGLAGKILITVYFFFSEIQGTLKINDHEVTEITTPVLFGIILKIAISVIFIYTVYILRKVVRNFFRGKLFTTIQIAGLKLTGRLIIFATLGEIAVDFLLHLVLKNKLSVGIEMESSFNSLWFTLALGLFFILLSKAFSHARNLQEENDLIV